MSDALTIGASEAAAVAGLDPYMDPTTLGLRKLGRIPEAPQSESAALGLLLAWRERDAESERQEIISALDEARERGGCPVRRPTLADHEDAHRERERNT